MEKSNPQEDTTIPVQAIKLLDLAIPDEKVHIFEKGVPISICTYNILADCFINEDENIPKKYLEFSYRSKLVVETVKKIDSDIYILQEVDHISDLYSDAFAQIGYSLIAQYRKEHKDAVVVLYKKSKFDLEKFTSLEFDSGHPLTQYDMYQKDNVGVCVELIHKEAKKKVVVLGCHLHWNPKVQQIRYLQTCMVIDFLQTHYKSDDVVFWGGDLNSKPDDNNIVYVFSRDEPVKENVTIDDVKIIKNQKTIYSKYAEKKTGYIEFLNLYSRYGEALGKKDLIFPNYTNYKADFKATLDHIFFNPKTATPVKLLKVDEEGVQNNANLPCKDYPSDHLPIMGVFMI